MLIIREERNEDRPALAAARAAWAGEQDAGLDEDPDFEAVYSGWMDANPRKFFVAEQDGELVGMLNLLVFERMPKPGKPSSCWVYLGNVYVVPARRNAGIGAQLVQRAIEFSQGIKAVRMVLSPSPASRSFYARLGFRPAAELNILRF
ncbi:GNAT family N-acetyltransferase [Arthrobacter sp. UKPF54-2]|uniref:GNAT family N-acetyltransferase n=1 Tax=Arthrobacter sp. UKPF54-2 TaxID=2600159 RepID=UPI0011B158D3|nr:GNAT family N-acetyltransferase [Arthrobacter sp. UKPF54-2]QDY90882.1 GNAT family N-acetyltransferase [Arthrobacter sp. UKPF54-2]